MQEIGYTRTFHREKGDGPVISFVPTVDGEGYYKTILKLTIRKRTCEIPLQLWVSEGYDRMNNKPIIWGFTDNRIDTREFFYKGYHRGCRQEEK